MSAGGGAFPSTRHSVVRAIGDADPDVRREAYGALVRSFGSPFTSTSAFAGTAIRSTRRI
jgi:hypothetical protein